MVFWFKQWQNSIFLNQDYCFKLKCTFYLSVTVFSSKVPIEGTTAMSLASHAGVFRGARISSLPTNACSTENNIPFSLFYLRGR